MESTTIKCDACSRDLTQKHRLVLSYTWCGQLGSTLYVEPLLQGDLHFCRFECLDDWLSKKIGKKRRTPDMDGELLRDILYMREALAVALEAIQASPLDSRTAQAMCKAGIFTADRLTKQ